MSKHELMMLMAATIAAPQLHDYRDGASQHASIFDRAVAIAKTALDRHLEPEPPVETPGDPTP